MYEILYWQIVETNVRTENYLKFSNEMLPDLRHIIHLDYIDSMWCTSVKLFKNRYHDK